MLQALRLPTGDGAADRWRDARAVRGRSRLTATVASSPALSRQGPPRRGPGRDEQSRIAGDVESHLPFPNKPDPPHVTGQSEATLDPFNSGFTGVPLQSPSWGRQREEARRRTNTGTPQAPRRQDCVVLEVPHFPARCPVPCPGSPLPSSMAFNGAPRTRAVSLLGPGQLVLTFVARGHARWSERVAEKERRCSQDQRRGFTRGRPVPHVVNSPGLVWLHGKQLQPTWVQTACPGMNITLLPRC